MKVLITGGAGFIGSTVTDLLLAENHSVLVIDNFATGKPENNQAHPNLRVIKGSIAEPSLVNKLFEEFRPELVLHAAASYKDSENWQEDVLTNITGTVNIVKACKTFRTKRLIYLQTSLCYGLHPVENPITLKHPLYSGGSQGGSSYAISKTAGEQYIELSGIDFISFRLANVFGPRNLSGPLPAFFKHISNHEVCTIVNTKRDFIYIDDVVTVIIKAFSGLGKKGYYHIATGSDHSIKELYELTVKHMNCAVNEAINKDMASDDVKTILLDPSKTMMDFNWKPEISFEQGIKNSIAWYKNHSLSKTYTHLKNIN